MSQQKIKKAVIAAAGFGTRFLPQTKAMPKEMLPLLDKPIIQYIVEELAEAGIEDIIIVTGYHKRSIEDHFDYMSADLRENLRMGGKRQLLENTKKISDLANFAYIRQKGPYGNATPLLNAEHLVGGEPFIYTFADDFVQAKPSRFKQIIDIHNNRGGIVLSCVPASRASDYKKYGFVSGKQTDKGLIRTDKVVEKPMTKQKSPSDIASVSGYVLTPGIFKYLHQDRESLKKSQEFIMQPAMQRMINDGHEVWAKVIENGNFYDTGDKLEYIKTVIDFALKDQEISRDIREFISKKGDVV
jgi:UTP--glucose-1-phosphate uridylyltransferase